MRQSTVVYCLLFVGVLSSIGATDPKRDQSVQAGYNQLVEGVKNH